MSFDMIEYYKALNGESSLSNDTWYVNYDQRHAFKVYSDVDGYNPSTESMYVPPSDESTEDIVIFSDKLGQKLNNTKIVADTSGNENVELELGDRIVTIITDQSGSMTWNDNGKFRHVMAQDLIDKIDKSYPGNVRYNLVDYGAKFINVLLFGVIAEDGINPYDVDSLNAMFQADENANYDGIRIVRNTSAYPSNPLDGDIVYDGFVNRILDDELTEDQTYYYTIYTYDDAGIFSKGVNIKVTPRDRIIPRGISVFKTPVKTDDLNVGSPFIGFGVNRDDSAMAIWHMNEGSGRYVYDFSQTGATLTHVNENPVWHDSRFVPVGTSGLLFDGLTDYLSFADTHDDLQLTLDGVSNDSFTIFAWVFSYGNNGEYQSILNKSGGVVSNYHFGIDDNNKLFFLGQSVLYTSSDSGLDMEYNKWLCVGVSYDSVSEEITFFKNDAREAVPAPGLMSDMNPSLSVFVGEYEGEKWWGKIAEVALFREAKSAEWVSSQIIEQNIYDSQKNIVGTYNIGRKDDNGDRLVVLEYEIPEDYDFVGGEVIIVKNEKHIPSWEEDGSILYQGAATPGKSFIFDADNFALGETYYYRIFSKNSLGNVSFLSDSSYLEINIPTSPTSDYFEPLTSSIPNPAEPSVGKLITPGNEKVYLRWSQQSSQSNQDVPQSGQESLDSRISRVKIYYRNDHYPVVDVYGGNKNDLVFTGLVTDEKFVHRGLTNDIPSYYTIVNVDRYGRSSGYNPDGSRAYDLLQISTTPTQLSDEGTIPLVDIENVNYEIRDDNAISIGWSQPMKSPEDIDAYFDQSVLVYASLTDEYGIPLPEYASIKMYITSDIVRETQAEDVFDTIAVTDFDDKDAYSFFVSRTDQGFLKATLRMTSNTEIISQIRSASFTIQLKSYVPQAGGYTPPNTESVSTNPLAEYAKAIEDEINGGETATTTTSGNVFEYYSKKFTVNFANPWEITLSSLKDSQRVFERCYYQVVDKITKEVSLGVENEMFYGVPMKASSPFIARAKVTYKGSPVDDTSLQIAVWDADSSSLCASAGGESRSPFGYEGEKLKPSVTVLPPDENVSVLQGTEQIPGPDGDMIDSPISYVDIPLYAPDKPQAVRLFVKGEQAGYSSVKDMYILFQSILRLDITAKTPNVDGADVSEQICHAYVVNPDYPDLTNPYSRSLTVPVANLTIVKWNINLISGNNARNIYSTDNVSALNGVFSYTRNGTARNVFLGPIQTTSAEFKETHEISAEVVYNGLIAQAKSYIYLEYVPTEYDRFGSKFLMEVDGGWRDDGAIDGSSGAIGSFGGAGWLNSDNYGNALWTDGSHYKRMKIHRNPAATNQFEASSAFNDCASKDSQIFELNSGQIIQIDLGDEDIEILHGDISEEIDPHNGRHILVVNEDGFIDKGKAFIELRDESVSDITYFYIRVNKFVPGSGRRNFTYEKDDEPINSCLQLKPSGGLYLKDLPEWEPYMVVYGTTTLFVNNKPLVLSGGGDFYTGVPPCPICLLEPLAMSTEHRKVTNYAYNEILGDPSNDYLYPIVVYAQNDQFMDEDFNSLINTQSDIEIRVKISWSGRNVPDGTPVYTSIGDNSSKTLFIAGRNIYYTETDADNGYSYVDVNIEVRKVPSVTTKENVEIYTIYDENGETDRHIGQNFSLTIDVKDIVIEPPVIEVPDDPSIPVDPPPISPFTGIMHKYDIIANEWSVVTGLSEGRGNFFIGEVNGKIYVIGGLLNNSLNISSSTWEYDIVLDTWNKKKSMLTPRFGGSSVTIGNNIYVIGGVVYDKAYGMGLSVSGVVEVYHADSDTWATMEHMPVSSPGAFDEMELNVAFGAAQHVAINGDNYIYVIGGVRDLTADTTTSKIRSYNENILRYHVESDSWEYSSRLYSDDLVTYTRIYPLSVVYGDKISVFNGAIDNGYDFIYPEDDFYIMVEKVFNNTPVDGRWIHSGSGLFSKSPVKKFQSAMVRYDDSPSSTTDAEYFIMGGSNDQSSSLDIVEKLVGWSGGFTYMNSYEESSSTLSSLKTGRHGLQAVYSDAGGSPAIYLVGGYTSAQNDDFVDITFDV